MTRFIYVTNDGNDLDGDGTPDNPFRSEERAELEAQVGDTILIFHQGEPVIRPLALGKSKSLWSSTKLLRGYLFGVAVGVAVPYVHQPLAIVTITIAATVVVLLLGRDD